jgi:hypothetical protein
MSSEPTVVSAAESACERRLHQSLCWGAILAGAVTTMGLYLLLVVMGKGAGAASIKPMVEAYAAATFSTGAAIACSLSAIIALSLGGWVAGRCSYCFRSGLIHGVVVWGLTLLITLPMMIGCAHLASARAMKHQVETLRMEREAVLFAENTLTATATERSRVQLASFVEEAVQSITTNAAPKAGTRAYREVGYAVDKLFAPVNVAAFPANRLEAINALMVYTEMSAADSTATIDAWIISCKNLQTELDKVQAEMNRSNALAEQKAQDAAAMNTAQIQQQHSRAARWLFFALLVGLLGAALGGRCGAKCASKTESGG